MKTNDDIVRELIAMQERDLSVRERLLEDGSLFDGYNVEMEAVHRENAARLREIIAEIGWPTISRVGAAASDAAWLIVQHSIGEPQFMRDCLRLISDAGEDVNPQHLAYLHDRICTFEGRPQRYGTQFDENMRMCPVEDASTVNGLRSGIGLEPYDDDKIVTTSDSSVDTANAPDNSDYDDWRRRVGWIV